MSYWMGAILRVARPEMAPRRHLWRRSVPATLPHDVPSYDLALSQIWAKSVEKRQSYCIFSVLEVPPEVAPRRHFRFNDRRHLFVFRFSYLGESPHKISDLYVKKWLRKGKMKNILQTHRQTHTPCLSYSRLEKKFFEPTKKLITSHAV